MAKLSDSVEKKISAMLPNSFAIVFDGWSIGSTHYVAIFATFPTDDAIGYKKVLLSFSPINDEDSLSAIAHYDYLSFVLEVYGKNMSNVVALIGDNCSVNVAFARRCGLPLVGCASHRFNLFVNDILTDYEPLLEAVNDLMKKLKNLIPAAKLRRLTPLAVKTRNVTRWSSTYAMLRRYSDTKHFIRQVNDRSVLPYLLSSDQDKEVDKLLLLLADLNSATVALQSEVATMAFVRVLFDETMRTYPSARSRLGVDADIVHFQDFENAVVKIMNQSANTMSVGELESVGRLKSTAKPSSEAQDKPTTILERTKKKQKTMQDQSVYMDCRFIRPTSNMCERFFSWAKYALNDRRRGTSPQNFEQQMFLKVNSDLWDVSDVAGLVGR
ncbi:hypothetical protein DYB37_012316 [Aphanomyces astaci]|uniref:HAT C-terminal dimerisation domain-containing protein n=1 Tax=Aphanomyces astaci TaxID=112090 RepID=A0A397C4J0_APHAT|nr:hypothetical protein DYB36_012871 [Aphanomyces astaci]RHY39443.1 hypothetical protein DYB38_009122 [Aphanomyces astaci]RHY41935.1 hypothetical protein DYB34_001462 [Aphanomyces astaci]RHZ17489.1 hypothetical protein DYB26_006521 [Aphanomyces astaci]RHZ31581.1 hypothetical protein DYB37_012316 [Aphanomyces astaci]